MAMRYAHILKFTVISFFILSKIVTTYQFYLFSPNVAQQHRNGKYHKFAKKIEEVGICSTLILSYLYTSYKIPSKDPT